MLFGYGGGGGGGGTTSPLTTKGDVYGFSTENARLPIGADGKVLMADSNEALGIKWENIPTPPKGVGEKLFLYNNGWGGL